MMVNRIYTCIINASYGLKYRLNPTGFCKSVGKQLIIIKTKLKTEGLETRIGRQNDDDNDDGDDDDNNDFKFNVVSSLELHVFQNGLLASLTVRFS